MSEIINDKTIYSLLEVTRSIQKTLAERYKSSYWIKAEMNKLNLYSHSGHCYPELVEKQDGKVVAQIKANLWKDDFRIINSKFLQVLKEPLKEGIKILFLANISFDPVYGIALRIIDIDPVFTLGDLEREKKETIDKMKLEGIFDRNKSLQIPLLPQRIAIISVDTSKGYADFVKVLQTNPWGYAFFHLLFPSLLQGEKAIGSIISQLKRIKKVKSHFDVVAIIRGGGGDIGLSCYNNYKLAKEIALFPIPVITGIGHATNETVVEMISFSNAITPTKIAEYLLQTFHNFSGPVQKAEEKLIDKSRRLINDEKTKFQSEVKLFRSVTENILNENRNQVKAQGRSLKKDIANQLNHSRLQIVRFSQDVRKESGIMLKTSSQLLFQTKARFIDKTFQQLKNEATFLNSIEKNIHNMSPQNVLKRGYSITLNNGKAIKSFQQVKEGDSINTILFEGEINSIVKSTQKPD